MRQTQLNVAALVLIGSASLRRRQFKFRKLLNSYRAGAHCDLVTHDVSALFSEESIPKNFTFTFHFNVTRGNPAKYPRMAKNPPKYTPVYILQQSNYRWLCDRTCFSS